MNAKQVLLTSPILSQRKLRQLLALPHLVDRKVRIDLYYDEAMVSRQRSTICAEAVGRCATVRDIVLLSDRFPQPGLTQIHALLATAAIHAHLTAQHFAATAI